MARALADHGRAGEVFAHIKPEKGWRDSVDDALDTPSRRKPTAPTVWVLEHGEEDEGEIAHLRGLLAA